MIPSPDWSQNARYLHLAGWCFAAFGPEVTEVRARVRRKIFAAYYGIPRPDVSAAYGRQPGSLRNGFAIDAIVPWGRSRLVLEARSHGEKWEPFFTHPIRGPFAWHHEDIESPIGNYPAWIRRYDTLTRTNREWIKADIARRQNPPLFSVLMPVYNPAPKWLQRAIESVRAQLYQRWELCIVDDASTDPRVWKLLQRYAKRDARVKLLRHSQNTHIAAASNAALGLATGDFLAPMDHDDELAPTALYLAAREIARNPAMQLLYSDEDKLDAHGRRFDPHFKPDWNPDLFASQNYISHLSILAAPLVRAVGGFRLGFEGSQDYDLVWRCVERIEPHQIHHIPHVLYHWRSASGWSYCATRR